MTQRWDSECVTRAGSSARQSSLKLWKNQGPCGYGFSLWSIVPLALSSAREFSRPPWKGFRVIFTETTDSNAVWHFSRYPVYAISPFLPHPLYCASGPFQSVLGTGGLCLFQLWDHFMANSTKEVTTYEKSPLNSKRTWIIPVSSLRKLYLISNRLCSSRYPAPPPPSKRAAFSGFPNWLLTVHPLLPSFSYHQHCSA